MDKNSKIRMMVILAAVFSFFLLGTRDTKAAQLYFETPEVKIEQGSYFWVDVKLKTENDSINTFESLITFPADKLKLAGNSDGDSLINLWIVKSFDGANTKGEISMAGLTPGGIRATEGKLISLQFFALKNGPAQLGFKNSRAYINNAEASEANLKTKSLALYISPELEKMPEQPELVDNSPPLKFDIYISSSPDMFNDNKFVSFATQDKDSGINHYEIEELFLGVWGEWKIATSPYQLVRQSLFSIIRVKAIDNVGKITVESYFPNRLALLYIITTLLIIVLVFCIIKGLKRPGLRNV